MPPLELETIAPPPNSPLLAPDAPAPRVDEDAVVAEVRDAITEATYAPSFPTLDEDALHAARRAAIDIATATLAASSAETAAHSDDVDIIAEGVGRRLGLSGPRLEDLRVAARLHDIGKLGVPRRIIEKPARLDPAEWAVIRRHTIIGEQILLAVPELRKAARLVRHSHERWDGGGYPDGLAGEQIPLGSRIVFCADAYDAIRSDRAYRAGRPAAEALAEIRSCAGTQFDPAVVEALEDLAAELRAIPEVRRRAAFGRSRRLMGLMLVISVGACGSAFARSGVLPEAKAPAGPTAAAGQSAAGTPLAASPGSESGMAAEGQVELPGPAPGQRGGPAAPGSASGLLTSMPAQLIVPSDQFGAATTPSSPAAPVSAGQDSEAPAGAGTAAATGSAGGEANSVAPGTNPAQKGNGRGKSRSHEGHGGGSSQASGTPSTSAKTGSGETATEAKTNSKGGSSDSKASGSSAFSTSKGSSGKSSSSGMTSSAGKGKGSSTTATSGQTDVPASSNSGKGKKESSKGSGSSGSVPPASPQGGAPPQAPPAPNGSGPGGGGSQGGSGSSGGSAHGGGHGHG